jgi:phage-related protein
VAVVGDAYIVVRAYTDRVKDDIRDGFRGADREGERAGKEVSDGLDRGFKRGAGGRDGMFKNLQRNADAAREKFNRLIQIGYILGPALTGVAAALGGAAAGLFAIGAQAAAAGPALLSLLNVLSAVAQAGLTLMAVFKGVGSAIGAGLQGSSGGGGGGGSNAAARLAKQIERANERIEEAKKRLAKVISENSKRIEQAQKNIERASRAVADAQYDAIKAGEAVVDAEDDLQKAYDATSRARKEAKEDIQQLQFALEESVLSEERAALNFEKAREAYAKAQNLPPDNRVRKEAELAFKEADLRLRKAIDKRQDTQSAEAEMSAKGVEGSDKVVSALERERKAAKSIDDAKRSAFLANRDLNDALEAEVDARNELNEVIAENFSRLKEAEKAIRDAKRDLDDLKDSAGSGGASGGIDKFAEAMAKLSPKAQEFVRIILDIVEAFKPIKLLAQDAFFGNFNDAVKELADVYLPVLEEKLPITAGLLGEIGANILGVVSSTENVARVERIWDSNDKIIGDLGKTVENLVDIFIILLDNLRPLAEEFSGWIKDVTTGWRETITLKDKTGELKKSFEDSAVVVRQLGRIFGNLFRSIMNLGKAAAGPGSGGQMLFDLLEDLTAKWLEFTGSTEGQNKLEKYFQDIVPIVSEFGGLIGDIFGAFFRLAGETADETTSVIQSLRYVVGVFEEMGGAIASALPIAGEFLEKSTDAINNLTSSGAIDAFFGVLRDAATVIADITGSPIFQKIFAIVAPIFAVSRGLSLVFKFLKFIFLGSIVGNITKFSKVFGGLKSVIAVLKNPIIALQLGFLKLAPALGLLKLAFGPIGLAIMGAVAAFIAMWNESEIFREAIKSLIDGVLTALKNVFNDVKQAVEDALVPFGGMEGVVDKLKTVFKFLGDIIGTYVIPVLEFLVTFFIKQLGVVIVIIIKAVAVLAAAFKIAWDLIYAAVEFVVNWFQDTAWPIIQTVIDFIISYYQTLWSVAQTVWNGIYGVIETLVNWFRNTAWPIIQTVIGYIQGAFNSLKIILEVAWNLIKLGIEAVVNWFRDNAWPVIETVIGFIKTGYDTLKTGVETAWNLIKTAINTVATWLKNTLQPIVTAVWDAIKSAADTLKKNIETIWNNIKTGINTAVKAIKGFVKPIWDGIESGIKAIKRTIVGDNGEGGIWGSIKTAIDTVVGAIKGIISGIWNGLTTGLSTAVTTIKNTLNGIIRIVNNVIRGFNFLPGPDLPYIPELAEGGVIRPRSGGTLALIAEAGQAERVEPLDENGLSKRDKAMISFLSGGGGGGATINVYPSAGMDERELAQKVSRELALQVRRGAL